MTSCELRIAASKAALAESADYGGHKFEFSPRNSICEDVSLAIKEPHKASNSSELPPEGSWLRWRRDKI